jgi:hypothetical protein
MVRYFWRTIFGAGGQGFWKIEYGSASKNLGFNAGVRTMEKLRTIRKGSRTLGKAAEGNQPQGG